MPRVVTITDNITAANIGEQLTPGAFVDFLENLNPNRSYTLTLGVQTILLGAGPNSEGLCCACGQPVEDEDEDDEDDPGYECLNCGSVFAKPFDQCPDCGHPEREFR